MRVRLWDKRPGTIWCRIGLYGLFWAMLGFSQPAWAEKGWEFWRAADPNSTLTVDHTAWERLLQSRVIPAADGINRFDYAAVSPAQKQALADYLSQLAVVSVRQLNRDQQLAYWINLYNALTIQVILDHYPVASIRDIDISPGILADGPWGAKLATIEGQPVSLDDIEHRILRPLWQDNRVHYAINCASLGCPNLMTEAFTATNLQRLLDAGATAYINHPRGVRLVGNRLIVSSIYAWFRQDFGADDAAVIGHLRRFANPDLSARLAARTKIDADDYDWRLNAP